MAPVVVAQDHLNTKNKSRPQDKDKGNDSEDGDQSDSSESSRFSDSAADDEDEIETFWIGPSVLGHPRYLHNSKAKQIKLYQAVKLVRDEKFSYVAGVGDFVHLRSSSDNPYIGRVMDLFEDSEGDKFAIVQWLYMPNDIKALAGQNLKYEVVYAAKHLDKIEVETIIEPVRIQFEIKCSDGREKIVKSRLYSDAKDSDNFCLYKCRYFYDLGSRVTPLTEEKFREIEHVPFNDTRVGKDETVNLLTSEDETRSRNSHNNGEGESSRSSAGSEESEEEISTDEEKRKRKRLRVSQSKKSRKSHSTATTTTTVSTRQSNTFQPELGRVSHQKATKSSSDRVPRVVDDENLVHRHREMTNSTTKVSDVMASMRSSLITDLDEKLWNLFQDIRNDLGSDEALEILGYLKLEYLTENDSRSPVEKIYPPSYISGFMQNPNSQNSIVKIRKLLGLQNNKNTDKLSSKEISVCIRQAFKELEQCRPGVVLDQVAASDRDAGFETPRNVSLPLFGALLGLDGFRTCEMIYHRQLMRIPIEREGSVAQAAFRAFSNLVMSSFSFVLVRTGDFTFEVAPSPEEKCDQIFIKLPSDRTVSLHIPAKKTLLRFIKVLLAESEGIRMDKQSFLFYGKHFGEEPQDDSTPLAQFHVKFASTLTLLAK